MNVLPKTTENNGRSLLWPDVRRLDKEEYVTERDDLASDVNVMSLKLIIDKSTALVLRSDSL